ncbi:SDR family NAD(P)-dependent oxidoreductase [Frankia sp. CNm7]|uniref:SDR family NAD(P)-dependent oxidoreductase n=1 Tax=Frankia nepalensis TaxID=1836974 RepID=A0A937UT05_9ACTN|nr:SDR family NAD(P)-dependent oxidoreductase [Frankia nepalensis]MBL7498958.1 SDR family NAD(P)-dependent oxidoreductase [Frankia nepalensis]MBL7511245.1 SDR family NAD(P)-dependent oxidoreductase [Frankia nepalensis]MBL7520581.1 SDR family NAD(P)-dependent oxidoreductase [Frankia nepalensis]MBL7630765.1 SDR family NAD(P)-dependent oxidoreductase [Frankia nepalensis]
MNVNDSIALVTGANRGLGARLVSQLLDAGASKVYATARDPRAITPAVSADPRVSILTLDVTDQSSVDAAAKVATDVTLLVNNAGVLGFGGALDGDLDLFQRDMLTNQIGLLRVSQAFVPILTENAPGAIVNVLTLIALAPVVGMAGYCASKAAAHSITQSLRAELRGTGIEVVGAYPGGIDTDMLAGVDAVKAPPRVVAERIVAGIATGQTVIWPDDASAGAGSVYLTDPLRLEGMLAG